MSKFIAFAVRVLLQQNGRDRAIQNEVATIQQDLLDRLPSFNPSSRGLWRMSRVIVVRLLIMYQGLVIVVRRLLLRLALIVTIKIFTMVM